MSKESKPFPITVASALASCYPIGFIRKAPGTWGSLPGLVLGQAVAWGLQLWHGETPGVWLLTIIAMMGVVGISWWSIDRTEALWNTHDDKRIVIDEVAGQSIACAFFPMNWQQLLLSFLLFRLLDIAKPGPIGKIDRDWPGAFGTLFDDVLAGAVIALGWVLWFYARSI